MAKKFFIYLVVVNFLVNFAFKNLNLTTLFRLFECLGKTIAISVI